MNTPPRIHRVGDVTVTRIDEIALGAFTPRMLYPDAEADADLIESHGGALGPGSIDRTAGTLVQSIHSWLVRTPHHTILVDTATGNGKARPYAPVLDHLNEPYLARLAAAGVAPEDVDYVLITHLHADHVGWNTQADGDSWRPTFPKARYVFSATELRYNEDLAAGQPAGADAARLPYPGVYQDSVRPVVEAGLAQPIAIDGNEFLDGLSFVPTPGHSVDHASIRLVSRGQEALFAGDVMHHPLQVYAPELNSCFCEYLDAARLSRRWVLEHAAERDALVFSSHFAETGAGRITRRGERFDWQFVDGGR